MNTYYIGGMPVTDELYHHGILGQKWGVRRYQNPDGTLTPAGKKRYYGVGEGTDTGGSGGTSRAHYRVGNAATVAGPKSASGNSGNRNIDGSLTEQGKTKYANAKEGKKNRKEMHDAYSRVIDDHADPFEYAERKLGERLGDDYKLLRYNYDIARKESGYDEALRRRKEAQAALDKNKRPFAMKNNKALMDEVVNAGAEAIAKSALADTYFTNMTMDMVNNMPKDIRDEAMAYAYMWAGYDW